MKKLAILTLLIVLTIPKAFSYDFTNKEIALISLNININKDVKEIIDKSDPTFLSSQKGQTKFRFICYYSVENLMKSKGINVFPYQCFGPKVQTDSYGFPDILINKAIKTDVAKFYYKLNIEILLVQMESSNKARLAVKMILTPYRNRSIIQMDKIDIDIESEIILDGTLLNGFTSNVDEIKEGTLISAINKAADKLTKIMVQK